MENKICKNCKNFNTYRHKDGFGECENIRNYKKINKHIYLTSDYKKDDYLPVYMSESFGCINFINKN